MYPTPTREKREDYKGIMIGLPEKIEVFGFTLKRTHYLALGGLIVLFFIALWFMTTKSWIKSSVDERLYSPEKEE